MEYLLHLLIQVSVFAVLALGQNVILGRAGMLFVAQASLFAVGAYATAISASLGVSSSVSLIVGTAAAVAIGFPMGLPALRLRGDFLLVASLGLCEIVRSFLNNSDRLTGGAAGFMNIPALKVFGIVFTGPGRIAPIVIGVLCLCVLFFYLIEHSPYGKLLTAIGEDADAVRGLGKSVRNAKISAVAISSAWAGLVGGIWAFYVSYLDPSSFTVWESVMVLAIVILGGADHIGGALVGSLVLVLLPEFLRFTGVPPTIAAPLRQIIYGAALILMMRIRPTGLLGKRLPAGGGG